MNFSLRCCRLLLRMWWAVSRLMTAPSILCVCEWESVWSDSSAHTHTAARCVVSCINRAWKWSFPWESLWCIVGLTGSTRSRGVRRGGGRAASAHYHKTSLAYSLRQAHTSFWTHEVVIVEFIYGAKQCDSLSLLQVCVCVCVDISRQAKMWTTDEEVGLIRKRANEGESVTER